MPTPQEAFQSIRRLQIKALRNVEDFFAGIYRSSFKGQGLEFEDVREYQEGDDIRTIDWNVTARSQHPYVKNFREERELTVLLIVDISASTSYSHKNRLKSEMIAELGALLAFSAIRNQDKIGLILFSNEVELYLRPQKDTRHVLRVIRELLYFKAKATGTDLKKALAFAGKVQKKHAICFLISDFYTTDFSRQASLLSKRHELIAIQVDDAYEQNFPSMGLLSLQDLESKQWTVINTSDSAVQQKFQSHAQDQQNLIKHLFEKIGVDLIKITTEESTAQTLYRFFQLRKHKR
jgi:uncharacterized protein (DUF58 family)